MAERFKKFENVEWAPKIPGYVVREQHELFLTPPPGIFVPLYKISKISNLSTVRTRKVGEVV